MTARPPGLLAHILSPSQAGKPHGPGPHRALFADAASLLADPGAGEAASRVAGVSRPGTSPAWSGAARLTGTSGTTSTPEAAAWLLLSVLSTRALRAAGMPRAAHLEPCVAALALGCHGLASRVRGPRRLIPGTWRTPAGSRLGCVSLSLAKLT